MLAYDHKAGDSIPMLISDRHLIPSGRNCNKLNFLGPTVILNLGLYYLTSISQLAASYQRFQWQSRPAPEPG